MKNKPLKSRNQFFGRRGEKHNKRLGEREERAGRIFLFFGGEGGEREGLLEKKHIFMQSS